MFDEIDVEIISVSDSIIDVDILIVNVDASNTHTHNHTMQCTCTNINADSPGLIQQCHNGMGITCSNGAILLQGKTIKQYASLHRTQCIIYSDTSIR